MIGLDALCRAEGVSCSLGGRAVLSEVDIEARPGRVLALVGPNGAGKSTLLGVLTGDISPSDGAVWLAGRVLSDWPTAELARRRSVLLQSNQVSFGFPVRDVVAMGRAPWMGRPEAERDEVVIGESLSRTDTERLADRPFPLLSGGEKARVSLARVLAQETPVVLLDEPTAALDLKHTEAVLQIARELAAAGRAVVVVLHDLTLAAAYADVVAVMDAGRIVSCGTPAEVFEPALLGSVYGVEVRVFPGPDDRLIIQPRRPAQADR